MSQRNDPFQNSDPRFEPWEGPQDKSEFSQPDLTPRTLRDWLRSTDAEQELGQMPQLPARTIVQFVETPSGLQLHVRRGDTTKIYSGPESELRKIARAANGAGS